MKKYKHKEAYAVMAYACQGNEVLDIDPCGHKEYIWNSRDGVTPFMVLCPQCKNRMFHVDWNADVAIENLNPIGIRWFIDQTKESLKTQLDIMYPDNDEVFSTIGGEITAMEFKQNTIDGFNHEDGHPDIIELKQVAKIIKEKINKDYGA